MKRCLFLWTYRWLGKTNETSLPEKEDFYSNLDMGDITDAGYAYTKRVYKNFEKKKN